MTFHEAPGFKEAVEAAATHFGLKEIFIEKDYWVTYVLRNLETSAFVETVVFKGGTALSKAHGCIERFSEDIDLAILKQDGITEGKLKSLIKDVETAVIPGLIYFKHQNEQKVGRNRKTFYQYPKQIEEEDFGAIRDHIQLEINSFTQPVPHERKEISSLVGKFIQPNFPDQVAQFGLEPFTVKVLTRQRTFFEKLLSVVRLSFTAPDQVPEKIRHFYDMHQILTQPDLLGNILSDENFELLDMVRADDQGNRTFAGDWLQQPMAAAPLFADHVASWRALTPKYTEELGQLTWSVLPAPSRIEASLGEIKTFLLRYDARPRNEPIILVP